MIQIHPEAATYFRHLLEQQETDGLALRIAVSRPGTPQAECQLTFCETDPEPESDVKVPCEGFDLFVDAASIDWLDEAELDFESDSTGGQLIIKAPNIRGHAPGEDADLGERVQYLLDSEINPSVAAHGGVVNLVEVDPEGYAILQFGGGCHGCGMVDVTLKDGIEKTLLKALPDLKGVRDVTDHSAGENPYYP